MSASQKNPWNAFHLRPQTTFPCIHSSGIKWSHPELHLRIRSERFPQHDRHCNIQPFLAIIAQPDNHQLTTAQLSSIARGSDRKTQTQPTSFGGSYFKHCCSRFQFKRDISTKNKKEKKARQYNTRTPKRSTWRRRQQRCRVSSLLRTLHVCVQKARVVSTICLQSVWTFVLFRWCVGNLCSSVCCLNDTFQLYSSAYLFCRFTRRSSECVRFMEMTSPNCILGLAQQLCNEGKCCCDVVSSGS